jgi:pimeloyl-ACP methyl ester carboxylesterase
MTGQLPVPGARLHYEILGSGEPIAFLNGILMTCGSWALQTAFFRRRYRCILHDFRGQLLSGDLSEPFTLQTHARDLALLLDHLSLESCHLVGTSYGGEVGLIFARDFPSRVRSLTVIASTARIDGKLRREVESWAAAARDRPDELYRTAARTSFSPAFRRSHAQILQLGEERLAEAPAAFFTGFRKLVDAFLALDLREDLEKIRAPVLVVGAEADALKPVALSRELASAIPGAELVEIPAAGHAVVLEAPNEVNRAILEMLERHHERP